MFDVSRRVVTTIDELVDTVDSGRTAPKTLRPGAIRAEWARADIGKVLVEVGDYSFPFATAGETVAHRIGLFTPLRQAVSGYFKGEELTPDVLHVWGEAAEVAGAIGEPVAVRDRVVRAGRAGSDGGGAGNRARPSGPRRVPHGARG